MTKRAHIENTDKGPRTILYHASRRSSAVRGMMSRCTRACRASFCARFRVSNNRETPFIPSNSHVYRKSAVLSQYNAPDLSISPQMGTGFFLFQRYLSFKLRIERGEKRLESISQWLQNSFADHKAESLQKERNDWSTHFNRNMLAAVCAQGDEIWKEPHSS